MKNNKSNYRSPNKKPEKKLYSIRVWDIPTRLFHWLLVKINVGLIGVRLITDVFWRIIFQKGILNIAKTQG